MRILEAVKQVAEESRLVKVILALRSGLTQIVEELNKVLDELAPPETRSALDIPKIDLADLDQAGWLTYQTKEPAAPGKAGWIKNPGQWPGFEAPPVLNELVKALAKVKPKPLQLGDMEYFFSGEDKFIGRRPTKQEGAK